MNPADFKLLSDKIKVPITHPDFFARIYEALSRKARKEWIQKDEALGDILGREYLDLSERLKRTELQEACSVRNILRTRALAIYLIDDAGNLSDDRLTRTIAALQKERYPLGPDRQHDARRRDHILNVLLLIRDYRELRARLLRISRPSTHRLVDQIIRDTLQLEPNVAITDADVRRATLAAWLTYLRQNVGSCFATAPAIIVQNEQAHQFLADADELMSTGRLKRTYGGTEYSVPISSTWGAGDLRKRFGLWRNMQSNNIWESPGIIAGFRSVKLIDSEMPVDQQITASKAIVENLIQLWEGDKPYVISDAEQLFRRALLTSLNLTEEDIQDYLHRPKPMMQSNLILQVPRERRNAGTKSERCARFFVEHEIACNAFKALTDNALLRTWEFTLASFAETKANFTKWNLYSSLGLGANEQGGIGNCLYQILQSRLEQVNRDVQRFQEDYEQQYDQIRYLEARIKRATTEQEAKWLNIENQMKRNEFYTIEALRNKAHAKARRYANLFSEIIEQYLELFPNYFQEVYDADLHEVSVGPYDDSPAGFRLLFKHGRTNTAAWTRIYNYVQYVEALASFFTMTEPVLSGSQQFEGFEEDIGHIVTSVVMHVKTTAFIESALYRMAAAQGGRMVKNPLQHLDLIEKKPWAYTSGGNMDTLISCYYRSDQHTETSRWVENELELAVFLLDTVKKMPPKVSEEYLSDPNRSFLIHSPTHAFLFRPGFELFKQGVFDKTFTYTWVRDQIFLPAKQFVTENFLDRELITHLIEVIERELLPPTLRDAYRDVFYSVPGRLSALELREHLIKEIARSPKLHPYGTPFAGPDEIDSFLYRSLPVTRAYDVERRITDILQATNGLTESEKENAIKLYIQWAGQGSATTPLTSQELQNIVKALICLVKGTVTSFNFHKEIARVCQTIGYAMPMPLVFADTNWVTDFFAFTVNPGTAQFELWRVDDTGTIGAPMSHWKQWLNGSKHTPTWGVFNNPNEYRS
ncbi:MAG: hypothetical protein Q8K75_11015 [Chlamydiales bacterium]|nr:hypothetical protein [Chlamydiales bacterium]